jgi:hypothetical protein
MTCAGCFFHDPAASSKI